MAKCEEQLPVMYFELPEGVPVETVLMNIGRRFHRLVNSKESVNLHRLMMTLGSQDPKLSQIFFEAGPLRVLREMEALLQRVDQHGLLRIEQPARAAEHFFCLLKGLVYMRVLMGLCPPPDRATREAHVREVVALFVAAYRPASGRAQ